MFSSIKKIIRKISPTSSYHSLNTIEINKNHILHNFHEIKKLQLNHIIIPVVKSNAYGHGLKQICTILNTISKKELPLIAVDSYPEYQIVADITDKNILVLGETLSANYHLYNPHRTHIAVGSLEVLQSLITTKKSWNIHIFLNTGMNREGFQKENLLQALKLLQEYTQISVAGVMSHLANADLVDNSFTERQIEIFKQGFQDIKSYGHTPKYIHISNSAGIAKIDDSLFTASRSGLALYGYNPLEKNDPSYDRYKDLRHALRLMSTVTALQKLKPGEGVNYGLSRTTDKPTILATLPLGYQEGLPRGSGDEYLVYYNSTPLPIRGKVCMNLSSCEIGDKTISIGDTIEVIGRDKNKKNTIEVLAETNHTIPYAILTGLDTNIKRIIV